MGRLDSEHSIRLADPCPTPVASGLSPVTAGDVTFAVARLRELPVALLVALAEGSVVGDGCRVCRVLQQGTYPCPHPAARALHDWHGSDALRCGVIYGAAAALLTEADRV